MASASILECSSCSLSLSVSENHVRDGASHNSVDVATRISIALSSFLACKPLAPLLMLAFFCARNSCSANCSCRSFRMVRTGTKGSSCSRLFDNTIVISEHRNTWNFCVLTANFPFNLASHRITCNDLLQSSLLACTTRRYGAILLQ